MMLYGTAGACIAGIPLVLLLVFQCCRNMSLEQQISGYKKLEQENLYLSVWTVKEDLAAGDKVTRSNLEKEEKWIPKTCNISQMTDPKQFVGRKAKTALKKGTVIRTDLLYGK